MDTKHPDAEAARELHALPAELQTFYRRLADDGASWQTSSAEKLNALAQTLAARAENMAHTAREATSNVQTSAPAPLVSRQAPPTFQPPEMSQRPPRRRDWIAGAFAAVAVVVLLAIVLQSGLAGGVRNPFGQTAQPTLTIPPGVWLTLGKLTVTRQPGMALFPALAPSNIQVEYALNYPPDGSTAGNASLRRTTDGGKTWKTLPVSVMPADSLSPTIGVSPLDAKTLFLTFWDQSTACAEHRSNLAPNAGCAHNYISTNGGDSWQHLTLPVPATLNPGLEPVSVVAQGRLLYTFNLCNPDSCTHLLKSADGGRTWQIADGDVADHGAYTCNFALAPAGTAIYDVASDKSCEKDISAGLETVWRSDDAGAHWTLVGPLLPKPVTDPSIGAWETWGTGGAPLLTSPDKTHAQMLYLNLPYVTGAAHDVRFYYSEDSGATWKLTPALSSALDVGGLGIFGAGSVPGVLGVGTATMLSDGSILFFASPDGPVTPYIWTPGTNTWQRLPKFPAEDDNLFIDQIMVNPGANGHDVITLVASYGADSRWYVLRYQF